MWQAPCCLVPWDMASSKLPFLHTKRGGSAPTWGEDVWGGIGSSPCRDIMVPVPPLHAGAVLACVVSRAFKKKKSKPRDSLGE